MNRFNAQKVYDEMLSSINADKISLNKVGNYMDRYAEVCIKWDFASNPKRLESFEKLFDKNAAKQFRSVAKAAPYWDGIKALRDSIDVPPSKGIAFTRLLVTNAGQTKAAPTKEFAKGKADDMWTKHNTPKESETSCISTTTLEKLAKRVEKTIEKHGAEWRGLPELLAAINNTVKLAKVSQPKAEAPTGNLTEKLDDIEMLKQQMGQIMQFIQTQK